MPNTVDTVDAAVDASLEKECRSLSLYLAGVDPPEYVLRKYGEAHALDVVRPPGGETRLDRVLVGLARRGPAGARVADAYASLFARRSTLRRKLVLLLAIMESVSPTDRSVDSVTPGSPVALIAATGARAGITLCLAVVSGLVLGPVHVVSRLGGRS